MITCERYHDFCAGHRVYGHENKCAHLHGHNYRVEVEIRGEIAPKDGFCNNVDFFLLDKEMEPILKQLDHNFLNDVSGLENPTAENIAEWILRELQKRQAIYFSVRVWETDDCWAQVVNRDGWFQKEHRE